MLQNIIVVNLPSFKYSLGDHFVQATCIGYNYGSLTRLGLICERQAEVSNGPGSDVEMTDESEVD